MSEIINWSVTANSASGGTVNTAGTTAGDATVSATVALEAAMGAVRNLALQVDDAAAITFLAISSTLNDGNVEVTPQGGTAIELSGPILLMGEAVALFASDLGTLGVQNTSPDTEATITVLVGLTL